MQNALTRFFLVWLFQAETCDQDFFFRWSFAFLSRNVREMLGNFCLITFSICFYRTLSLLLLFFFFSLLRDIYYYYYHLIFSFFFICIYFFIIIITFIFLFFKFISFYFLFFSFLLLSWLLFLVAWLSYSKFIPNVRVILNNYFGILVIST